MVIGSAQEAKHHLRGAPRPEQPETWELGNEWGKLRAVPDDLRFDF